MALAFRLLGTFQVTWADIPVRFTTDHVRALLAYLVVESEKVHLRTNLSTLLWPEEGEEKARHNLRQALFSLKQSLDVVPQRDRHLIVTPTTVQWKNEEVFVDLHTFQKSLQRSRQHSHADLRQCSECMERFDHALLLIQGEFLQGLLLKNSQPFEEWAIVLREQLHQQSMMMLSALSSHSLAQGNYPRVLQFAARQLLLEPWDEEAYRHLMHSYAMQGQISAALRQYEICRKKIQDELGVPPSPETTELYEQIRAGKMGPPDRQPDEDSTYKTDTLQPQLPRRMHNLPANLPRFVGRSQQLEQLRMLLSEPANRLITIVGMGGMGKSRLAIAFAEQMGAETPPTFAHGVWFISLTGVVAEAERLPDALAGAILKALEITTQNQAALPQALFHYLAERQMLLVLDNFEQFLVEECSVVATDFVQTLLSAAPGVILLVTSRLPFQLLAETVIRLGGLSAPATTIVNQVDAENYESVRLFVYHAQRALPGFALDADSLPAVIALCHALSGMPLALELAAALTPHFSPAELVAAIRQNLTILTSTRRDLDIRHRQFGAVLQSSWQLLSAREQQVLAQCAVFVGRFSRAAVQAITGATINELADLTNKALIQQPGVGVYQLHELLRQFASDKLRQNPADAHAVAVRHSAYYLNFLAQRERRLARSEPRQAVDEIQPEVDNVRYAWEWATEQLSQSQAATTICAQLEASAYAFWQFYLLTGLYAEGAALFQKTATRVDALLAALADDGEIRRNGQMLFCLLSAVAAQIFSAHGKYAEARQLAEPALMLSRTINSYAGELIAMLTLSQVRYFTGEALAAKEVLEQMLARSQEIPLDKEPPEICYDVQIAALLYLGSLAIRASEYTQAQSYLTQMVALCQRMGKVRTLMHALLNLANLARENLDFATARPEYEAVLHLAQELRYRWGEGIARQELGDVLRGLGEYSAAREQFERALTILHEIGLPQRASYARSQLGRVYACLGDYERAWALIEATIIPGQHVVNVWGMQEGWLAAAALCQLKGDYAQALHFATSCYQDARNDHRYGAIAFLCMGFALEGLQRWSEAQQSYENALPLFKKFALTPVLVEAQAGLARVALAQGDLAVALGWVEEILTLLPTQLHIGLDEPFLIYLTCYQILTANADPRAEEILLAGITELERYAAFISEPELRHSFYHVVPTHRALLEAYHTIESVDAVRNRRFED